MFKLLSVLISSLILVTVAVTETRPQPVPVVWKIYVDDPTDGKPFASRETWPTKEACEAVMNSKPARAAYGRLLLRFLVENGPSVKLGEPECREATLTGSPI